MQNIESVLNKEKRFLDLFGFKLGPNINNRYSIYDRNAEEIGYILFKEVKIKKNKSEYVYETLISTPCLHYECKERPIREIVPGFTFYIGGLDGKAYRVHMDLGPIISLDVRNKNEHIISFEVGYKRLAFYYRNKLDFLKQEDLVIYQGCDNEHGINGEYTHQITTCSPIASLDGIKNTATLAWDLILCLKCSNDSSPTELIEQYYQRVGVNEAITEPKTIEGTIEEKVIEEGQAVRSFSELRQILNSLLPVRKDFISQIISEEMIKEKELELFFTGIKEDYLFDLIPDHYSLKDARRMYKALSTIENEIVPIFGEEATKKQLIAWATPERIRSLTRGYNARKKISSFGSYSLRKKMAAATNTEPNS